VPVITIDGPTASGKGTLAAAVAQALGYHLLDSGALYRATGLAAHGTAWRRRRGGRGPRWPRGWTCASRPTAAAPGCAAATSATRCARSGAGLLASRVSALPAVREALHGLQLAFRRAPGLVADGRDMGTVVFPTPRSRCSSRPAPNSAPAHQAA
jgi:3-phosphoshikimate 1-carboxyvinyltransferase